MVVRGQQDLDANIVRWGLHHLLDAGGGCVHRPQSPTTDYAPPPPQPQRARALLDGYDMAPAPAPASDVRVDAVENDEVIAHALQEELAQVAMAEASGADGGEAERRATVLAQQWFRPEVVSHLPSAPPYVEEAESSSPRSSPEEDRNARDGHGCSIELVDDFSALDGEVGKRLNDMVPVPHVPKTNGDIPSFDEAFSDHRRLLDRLVLYGLVELKVNGDGNCQFRALSDQFYRTPEHHRFVRQQVVNQLESHPEIYAGYVPMDYREYLKKMPKIGEWGDHVTLQAAADLYGVKIFILTSFRDTCYIEILPVVQKSNRVICLSFWAEVHYNSIYPEGELPVVENRKKSLSDRRSFCSTM
ncbi:hypothetical protein VPH35_101802 [Triticum aestivum]|uniref:ubiquitinyl hydrolase 1 n=2 Tax=Triticinae TaxID=1648030 RepID=A0A453MK27_AEGTS|nr:OVARIAN TUMOR DOMAIN-containing deubiquitinating enzyme 12 isoform X1 [Aegilops tauschii subsp. strangulata]XP_020158919.1 OVARIAN TUMOR DOMAIN-containing deubiquitinating enzyme 12 isoform X1 [Aegilops tauschii subsp. strangulata]XP_044400481.1 OVARIAN TUMOR DOMAIN-containing deubiquitinating enzyme 12-like isoform X1 [Triticum aestivum]